MRSRDPKILKIHFLSFLLATATIAALHEINLEVSPGAVLKVQSKVLRISWSIGCVLINSQTTSITAIHCNFSISIRDRQLWHNTSFLTNGHQEQPWTLTLTQVCLTLRQIHPRPLIRAPSKQAKITRLMRVIRSFWVIYRHQRQHSRFQTFSLILKWAMLKSRLSTV